MKIELNIDGEKKLFTVPFVPMLAKRKYLEVQATAEEKEQNAKDNGNEYYMPSARDQLDEEDEMLSILADVVFDGKFTTEQLYKGASDKYVYEKLAEACFGKKKKENEGEEGNEQGE